MKFAFSEDTPAGRALRKRVCALIAAGEFARAKRLARMSLDNWVLAQWVLDDACRATGKRPAERKKGSGKL